ncbi:MAG: hypothetical protein NTY08_10770 [Proteobacteria bacterium]|nr:hypothetical protein [Pseudomonadota bacterium]
MGNLTGIKGQLNFALTGVTLAASLAVALSGCGKQSSSNALSTAGDQLTNSVWAKQMILASDSSAMGLKSSSKIERILLVKMSKVSGKLETSEQACDVTSTATGGATLVFPEAFKRSLPIRTASYQISNDAQGVALAGTQAVEVLGAKLADDSKDQIPTSADDPSVIDQDGDGQPGVTVDISAKAAFVTIKGKVYLVQRTITQETGRLESADLIRGNIKWSTDQKIIGSDSKILGAVQPTITELPEQSVFTMRKVSDTDTCASILSHKDQLFSRAE